MTHAKESSSGSTVAELRALLEKATPGPWSTRLAVAGVGLGRKSYCQQIVIGGREHTVGIVDVDYAETIERTSLGKGYVRDRVTKFKEPPPKPDVGPDAALIAALRNAAPDLLRVVEAAQRYRIAPSGSNSQALCDALDALETSR